MDSLGSLNAFVQAAEARSFTVAGRQLGVSSSAIGKAVGADGGTARRATCARLHAKSVPQAL